MRSNKYGLGLAITAVCMGFTANAASADVYATRFEQPKFTTGAVNGKDGWRQSNAALDNAINANNATQSAMGLGPQSLRTSNAVIATGFGDQLFSAELGDEAGETVAASNGASGGVRQDEFDAQFKFAAFDPTTNPTGTPAPGVSVTLDNGQGARMSQVRLNDLGADGLQVVFSTIGDNGVGNAATFNTQTVATGLDRTKAHTVKVEADFVEGPGNDVVKVTVDDNPAVTGGSWEQYYRNDPEQAGGGNRVPTTDQLMFRQAGTANGANSGKGILIDDVRIESKGNPTGPQGPQGNPGTSTTGPQGPAGATGPQGSSGLTPSSTTSTGKVSLVSKSLKINKKTRKVTVSISCPRANGLCEGRLNLINKGKTISRTAFNVRGGRSGKVTLTLSKKAYKALKKSQSVRLDVFSRDLAGAASSARKTLKLTK